VHEYSAIELKQVFDVAQKNIKNLNEYLASMSWEFGFVDGSFFSL